MKNREVVDVYSPAYKPDHKRLQSLQAVVSDSMRSMTYVDNRGQRKVMDADGSFFFARELEAIETQLYRVDYAEIMARQAFPVSNFGGNWTDEVTYRAIDRVGKAKIISTYGASDIPLVSVSAQEIRTAVKNFASSFKFTVMEIERARHTGIPLDAEEAFAARDVVERTMDETAWFGDVESNVQGLLNNGTIPRANVVNGVSGFPQWNKKTPAEILFDVLDGFATMLALTKQVEKPNTLAVPTYQYNLLVQPRSTTAPDSILEYIVKHVPSLEGNRDNVMSIPVLAGAGTIGADLMIIYRKDPSKLVYSIPLDVIVEDPQRIDLNFKSIVRAASAGVIVRKPLSVSFLEKI